ncbi:o-succinylbenzoate--CoA ligase [Knoellia subterranea]|uniref:MenE n=1 Tax=Knoellia subterranea KCTC 19937 TaxID=1385521 RepID=A0A0A0JM33_9MICO|nr:o-succinylbenzoate--CoA ligase [Knoellia subterranea]KGN38193.1 MenE [Knoellia subterranea KCTC 19937]
MRIEPLAVPAGAAVLDLLPRLRLALEGGHPIAPHAVGSPPPALSPSVDGDLPEDLGVVVGTSGSTGTPKRAMLGTRALQASADATHACLSGPGQWLLTLPAHHIAGLQVVLRSIAADTTPHVMDLANGFTPETFATTVDAMPVTDLPTYVSIVPTQLTRLLDDEASTQRLARFAAVLIGGAATHPDLLTRAASAGVHAVTTYGMSETAGGCVYDSIPLDGVDVLLDGDGRIHLAGATLAHGYFGEPALTTAAFVPSPPGVGVRSATMFRTDDIGQVDDEGRLHVDGRIDDLINTGGLKVAPRLVEEAVARIDGISEAVAVGVPDPEWGETIALALVVAPGHAAPTVSRLRDQLRGILADHALPRAVRKVPAIPLRGPGKPDRAAVRALFDTMGE